MTESEREFLLKELDQTRERLLGTVHGLSREQFEYREAPDRWSIAENLEHITFSEQLILGVVQKTSGTAPDSLKRSAWDGKDEALRSRVAVRREDRVQAPEVVRPGGRWSLPQLLPEFETTRTRTREFVAAANGDLRRSFYPHPLFGLIDCYQWLVVIGAHCDRHRAQCEEVKASPRFPR